MSDNMDHKTF